MKRELLNTTVLPKYNCSNCKHFVSENKIIKDFGYRNILTGEKVDNFYAKECNNLVHPLEDCVLRGFEAHSEQPSFSQTLNKELQEQAKIVEQRLWYHFANTEGEFNIPDGLPFMKEFLNEIDKFVGMVKTSKPMENNTIKTYKCLLCGRDKFTKKTPHQCVGGYRKRKLKWEEIYDTLSNE